VFIHWQAENDKKIFDYNYQATKESIARALQGKPTIDEVLQKYRARAIRSRAAPRAIVQSRFSES